MKIKYTLDDLGRYPFLPDVKQFLKRQNFTISKIIDDKKYRYLFDEALNRISIAGNGGVYNKKITNITVIHGVTYPTDIITFVLSLILLKTMSLRLLTKKFALSEARRTERFLESGLKKSYREKDIVLCIVFDLFSMKINESSVGFSISVSDYLTHTTSFHEKEWKLINRKVDDGLVYLSVHETVRLIRKQISSYIQSMIDEIPLSEDNAKLLKNHTKKIELTYREFRLPQLTTVGCYPPCIDYAINVLKKGENLSHSGRFMLAAYLLKIGQSIDDIVPLFIPAPDFNEKITRYQLKNIQTSQYLCPSCDKIESNGSCKRTLDCSGIINPIQFRKNNKIIRHN